MSSPSQPTSSNDPATAVKRALVTPPNAAAKLPAGEHGTKALDQSVNTQGHYIATGAKAPNVHAKPLGAYLPAVSPIAPNRQFDAALFQRARRR